MDILITDVDVKDIRFPTSLLADGSDAMVRNVSNFSSLHPKNVMVLLQGISLAFHFTFAIVNYDTFLYYSTLIRIIRARTLQLKPTRESKDMGSRLRWVEARKSVNTSRAYGKRHADIIRARRLLETNRNLYSCTSVQVNVLLDKRTEGK